MKKSEKATLEQWIELGNLSKKVYSELYELITKSANILPKSKINNLEKAYQELNKYRDKADSIMFLALDNQDTNLSSEFLLHIFYGDELVNIGKWCRSTKQENEKKYENI